MSLSDEQDFERITTGLVKAKNEILEVLQCVRASIGEIAADYIDRHLADGATGLRDTFGRLARPDRIQETETSFFENAATVRETFETLHVDQGLQTQFNHHLETFAIFDRFKQQLALSELQHPSLNITQDPQIWDTFKNTMRILGYLSHPVEFSLSGPLETNLEHQSLTLKGFLIGTSDIMAALQVSTVKPRSIDLYGLYGVILDTDILLPGADVSFLAPYWWIRGRRNINLKGEDGQPRYEGSKANAGVQGECAVAKNGEDGLSGNDGQEGGNFLGVVFKALRNLPSNLTIDVSGGHGGDGQDGGDGANGLEGEAGDVDKVKSQQKDVRISPPEPLLDEEMSWAQRNLTQNRNFKEIYRSGKHPTAGGNGGNGGAGGQPGNCGSAAIHSLLQGCGIVSQIGRAGNPGKGGTGGSVGRGQVFEGTRKNQYIMSGWREGLGNTPETESTVGSVVTGATIPLLGLHTLGSWIGATLASEWIEEPHEVIPVGIGNGLGGVEGELVPDPHSQRPAINAEEKGEAYQQYQERMFREEPLLKLLESEVAHLQEILMQDVATVLGDPALVEALTVEETTNASAYNGDAALGTIHRAQEVIKKIFERHLKEQESQNYRLRKVISWGKDIQRRIFGQAISFQDTFDAEIHQRYMHHMEAFRETSPEDAGRLLEEYYKWKCKLFTAAMDCELQKTFCTYSALALGTVERSREFKERLMAIGLGAVRQLPVPGISFIVSGVQGGVTLYVDRQVRIRGNRITALWEHRGLREAADFSADLSAHLGRRVSADNLHDLTVQSIKKLGFLGVDQAVSYVATQEEEPSLEELAVVPFEREEGAEREVPWLGGFARDWTLLEQELEERPPLQAWDLLRGRRVEADERMAQIANLVAEHRGLVETAVIGAAQLGANQVVSTWGTR